MVFNMCTNFVENRFSNLYTVGDSVYNVLCKSAGVYKIKIIIKNLKQPRFTNHI